MYTTLSLPILLFSAPALKDVHNSVVTHLVVLCSGSQGCTQLCRYPSCCSLLRLSRMYTTLSLPILLFSAPALKDVHNSVVTHLVVLCSRSQGCTQLCRYPSCCSLLPLSRMYTTLSLPILLFSAPALKDVHNSVVTHLVVLCSGSRKYTTLSLTM